MLKMKIRPNSVGKITLLLGCLVWWAATANAQFTPPGGGGRTAGRSGTGGTGATTRDYPNNTTVGEAMISVDTDGKRLIVVADEDTQVQVSQVVANMDRPKPQVLIKV